MELEDGSWLVEVWLASSDDCGGSSISAWPSGSREVSTLVLIKRAQHASYRDFRKTWGGSMDLFRTDFPF